VQVSQTVADVLVGVLEQIGVKHIFGLIPLEAEAIGLPAFKEGI
jgi:thiamine pyrophosphate-dependent acetolactate synthase large subunit-like protein